MVDDKRIDLTEEGLKDLKSELNERMTIIREEIADKIKIARDQGDLSENAAYKAAMEDKEFNENRIDKLQDMIKNAHVKEIDSSDNLLHIGERFKLENLENSKVASYMLVGGSEANPAEGKISVDSPIGSAVSGKKFGDKVTIDLPSGEVEFKIKKA